MDIAPDYRGLAEEVGIPIKAVVELFNRGLLHYPLQPGELPALRMFGAVWGAEVFLKMQLAPMSRVNRARIVTGAGLSKIECYVLHRYLTHDPGPKGSRLFIWQIYEELTHYYSVPPGQPKITKMIQLVRDRAYKLRKNSPDLVRLFLPGMRDDDVKKILDGHRKRQAVSTIFGY